MVVSVKEMYQKKCDAGVKLLFYLINLLLFYVLVAF